MSGSRVRRSGRPGGLWAALLLALPLLLSAPAAFGADAPTRRNEPHAGYAYPAGGQVGTTFKVNVGGRTLRRIEKVRFSGEGVTAQILYYYPPPRTLNGPERVLLQRRLKEIRDRKVATTPGERRSGRREKPRRKPQPLGKDGQEVKLPDHPLLKDLESKSIEELQEVARYFFIRRSPLQRKRSIEETVKILVTIAPDAEPGLRELRLETTGGVSNPVRFMVGLLPEVREREPNHPDVPAGRAATLPAVLNGQIFPKDIDRFRFKATRGQRLLLRAEARALVPYQADSVPGWMQATLTVYDEDGTEVAYADEWRFDPDPVLFFDVPRTGDYYVEVRDAIARGRDDFVYRVTVGELPFVTRIFPLGGRVGALTNAEVEGWNMNWRRLPLDTRTAANGRRESAWRQGDGITNEVAYAVDTLPEEVEVEPNDVPEQAKVLTLPRIVNGRIDAPGDVDLFAFEGRRGSKVVIDIDARTLGSPLDSVIRLIDPKGEVVAWNDDHTYEGLGTRGLGLQTHHADSYLLARLPRNGTYHVRVADVARQGGDAYAYRMRVGPPRPDVELYVMPSSINIPAGRAALVSVRAVRKDGYDGPIDLTFEDAPEGFHLGGGRIPEGQDRVSVTLTAPSAGLKTPIHPRMVGHVRVGRKMVERVVTPADDVMQAFLWRHVVPAQELTVAVQKRGGGFPVVTYADEDEPVRVRRGGKGVARFIINRRVPLKDLQFEPIAAPKGISIGEAKATHEGFTLEIKASREAERSGKIDNLIVEVFSDRMVPVRGQGKGKTKNKTKKTKPKLRRVRYSLGLMPAIPFRVTR